MRLHLFSISISERYSSSRMIRKSTHSEDSDWNGKPAINAGLFDFSLGNKRNHSQINLAWKSVSSINCGTTQQTNSKYKPACQLALLRWQQWRCTSDDKTAQFAVNVQDSWLAVEFGHWNRKVRTQDSRNFAHLNGAGGAVRSSAWRSVCARSAAKVGVSRFGAHVFERNNGGRWTVSGTTGRASIWPHKRALKSRVFCETFLSDAATPSEPVKCCRNLLAPTENIESETIRTF